MKALVFDTILRSRKLQLQNWRPDSCIIATRVAVRVATHYGIELQPVHVTTMVFNPYVTKLLVKTGGWPPPPEITEWVHSPRGWSVAIGFRSPEERAASAKGDVGHVVAVSAEALVDGSLDQAARPAKRMNLAPSWWRVDPKVAADFRAGTCSFGVVQEGCFHYYETASGDAFLRSPDWTEDWRTDRYVEWCIKTIDQRLAKKA